ncbi:MAG TPA: hypothetical protein PLZ84_07450 [Clostridia bacterium]|nr:hypothetical protein [Clostridia bacterium]
MKENLADLFEKAYGSEELTEKEVTALNQDVISVLEELDSYRETGVMPRYLSGLISDEPLKAAYLLAAGFAMSSKEEDVAIAEKIVDDALDGRFDRQALDKMIEGDL